MTPKLFEKELNAGAGNVTVWINSPGGDVFAAAQIYNMLMEYKGDVTVKVDALAASAASVIAMAGTSVLMSPVGMMMLHNPMTIAIGDSKEMQKAGEMLDEVKESIMNAYEIKTGLSRARISHLMDAESWFNAKKAVELGFADGILGGAEDTEDKAEGMMFSRTAVTNSLLSKLIPKPEEKKTPVEQLEKRAKSWEAAKAFLDTKRGSDGLLSAEDTETYEKMEKDVVDLGKEIERLERQAAIDAELNKPTSTPITNKPNADPDGEEKKGRASDKYRKTFWNAMRRKNFFDVDNALQVGTDSEGGYLVPDEFERTLVEALEEENFFRSIATVINTSSGDRKIPVVASKGEASWIDEEGAFPESDDAFGQVAISAYKVATMLKVSDELLNDSAFNLEAYISKEFGRRIGSKEEEAFFVGDGTGKPTGIFSATGGASDGVTTTTANITFDDVMDLFYSLKSPYRKKAHWVLNDTTVKALRKLKDNNGNYIWQPSVQAGQPDMILNRPYHTSAYAPELAVGAKVMVFGNFSYYWIADRQGRSFKRLNELFAANGQVGFLASQRVDGKLILAEAVKTLTMKAGSGA